MNPRQNASPILWIYGRPSAGKTTLATELKQRLESKAVRCMLIDGDQLRSGLCKDLGYSMSDRSENLRRAAELAKLLSDVGLFVIAAFVTPLIEHRKLVAEVLKDRPLKFFYLDCSHEACAERDAKGLFRQSLTGHLAQMTGVDSAFQPPGPESDDIIASSQEMTPEELSTLALRLCGF